VQDVISEDKSWLMRVPVGEGPGPRLAWMFFNYFYGYAPATDPTEEDEEDAWEPA